MIQRDSATVENLLMVSLILASGIFATGIQKNDTSITNDKFTADVVDAGGKLPPVLLIPVVLLDL
jgi:hypothetical protein